MLKENEIKEYVEEGVISIMNKIPFETLLSLDPELTNIQVSFPVYSIVFQDGLIFIPTGTKEKPKGLSLFKGKFLVISNVKDKHFFFKRSELIELINNNNKESGPFKRGIGPDFETTGFIIPVEKLEELIA